MENIVITTFYTGQVDPQRDLIWKPDYRRLKSLIDSVVQNNHKLVIIHDCFDVEDTEFVKHIKVESKINPYYQRWFDIEDYLKDNENVNKIFCVDGTDVQMLKSPFNEMHNSLIYVGDEGKLLGDEYTRTDWPHPVMQAFVDRKEGRALVNAGLFGSDRKTALRFLGIMTCLYEYLSEEILSPFDMSLFNMVCYDYFSDIMVHGHKINTTFQTFTPNDFSWWMHK